MKENEIQFYNKVNESKSSFRKKFEMCIKTKVVYQLSRSMINELICYYNLIDPKYKLVNFNCASCIFNAVKLIGDTYFRIDNEMKANEIKLFDYSNDVKSIENIEIPEVESTKEIIDPQLSLFEQDSNTVTVNDEIIEEKNEIIITNLEEKTEETVIENEEKTEEVVIETPKRGRPKSNK